MKWMTVSAALLFCCAATSDANAFFHHSNGCGCGCAPSCCIRLLRAVRRPRAAALRPRRAALRLLWPLLQLLRSGPRCGSFVLHPAVAAPSCCAPAPSCGCSAGELWLRLRLPPAHSPLPHPLPHALPQPLPQLRRLVPRRLRLRLQLRWMRRRLRRWMRWLRRWLRPRLPRPVRPQRLRMRLLV